MVVIQVDRIEGDWAVVLAGEDEIQIPSAWLPEGSGEGSAVHVELRSAPSELKDAVSARLQRLDKTDDGDDFSL